MKDVGFVFNSNWPALAKFYLAEYKYRVDNLICLAKFNALVNQLKNLLVQAIVINGSVTDLF